MDLDPFGAPTGTLRQFTAFVLAPRHSTLVPVEAATGLLSSLGIGWSLQCRGRMIPRPGHRLMLKTVDSAAVVAMSHSEWRPAEGRILEDRREVDAETWEYDTAQGTDDVPVGAFVLVLSRSPRSVTLPLLGAIATLAHHVGWGKPIGNVVAPAALRSDAFAWAVTELFTGVQRASDSVHNAYERFRAVAALWEHASADTVPT